MIFIKDTQLSMSQSLPYEMHANFYFLSNAKRYASNVDDNS